MSEPAPTVRALSCPQCGGTIALRAAGSSVSLICEHCGSTLDATDPELRTIKAAHAALHRPEIPLGTRAILRGMQWEVVGYLERSGGDGSWSEYLLFNPYEGYAFLVDDGRRFRLGRLLDRLPRTSGGSAYTEAEAFDRTGPAYSAKVNFVVGEFYWRVAVGEKVRVKDFARRGAMLSCEETESEQTWTRLELLGWGEAEKTFGIPPRSRWGAVGPDEPSPWADKLKGAWVIAGIAVAAILLMAMARAGTMRIAAADAEAVLDGPERSIVIHDIRLPAAHNRVEISASAPTLDNSWVDLDYSLVERRTQASYDAYGLAEHYSGSDSDGPWTEGNSAPIVTLASVPGGAYDLVVTAAAHRWQNPAQSSYASYLEGSAQSEAESVPIGLTIDAGGVFGGNVWLALLLVLAWPILLQILHMKFEKRRAEGSE